MSVYGRKIYFIIQNRLEIKVCLIYYVFEIFMNSLKLILITYKIVYFIIQLQKFY